MQAGGSEEALMQQIQQINEESPDMDSPSQFIFIQEPEK
jgi:hypothetical protein